MENEVAAIVAGLQPPLADGKVGFFWVVSDRSGRDKLLAESLALVEAEPYGDAITHPGGHYDFWEAMKARGPACLRARNLSGALLRTEYEDWPRGRVVFHTDKLRFALMLDHRLRTPSRMAMIQKEFRLPDGHYDVSSDGHYRPIRINVR
jgi:hypothetical protein